ncbi:MAG: hypothetical protein P4L57_08975 [Rhizomicrobium sp.]|nr:hypothetical protein [Rhizomicrobium sp.]
MIMLDFSQALAIQDVRKGLSKVGAFAAECLVKSLFSIFDDETIDEKQKGRLADQSFQEFREFAKSDISNTSVVAQRAADHVDRARRARRIRRVAAAAQADANLASALSPAARAVHHGEIQKREDTEMPTPTRESVNSQIHDIAKSFRKPGESPEQAYAGFIKHNEMGRQLLSLYNSLPVENVVTLPVRKAAQPSTQAHALLLAKAAEMKKANPKLSDEQAFARVWKDPNNRHLVEAHKRQQAALPLDAA